MKTIKDILKSNNVEERRRISNTLAISKEDKNALITNESNGGSASNGANIEYYKFKKGGTNQTEEGGEMVQTALRFSFCGYNIIYGEVNLTNHAIHVSPFVALGDRYEILAFSIIPSLKSIYKGVVINGGTLQERADQVCELEGLDKININDYLEPITEEEFYNIKPE